MKHLEHEDSPRCPIFHIRPQIVRNLGRDYSKEEHDAADVLPLLRPLTPLCLHPLSTPVTLVNPVLGLRIHTAMTAIHLFGTLSQ